jgi:hypothetical protein
VNPLPPKPISSEVHDFNRLLSVKFPDLFGPKADHRCQYREHLFQLVAADLQQSSTQNVAGASCNFFHLLFNTDPIPLALLSFKNPKAPLDFASLQSTLASNAGAGPSAGLRQTASSACPTPDLVERIAATSLSTVKEASQAINRISQPTPSEPSGSQAVLQQAWPAPQHIEVISIFR